MIALALAVLPGLLWTQGPESADALRKAGIAEVAVPAANAAAWSATGLRVVALDLAQAQKVDEPSVDYKMGTAGATGAPWINSNLWLYLRKPNAVYVCEAVARKNIPLALGEAFAAGVQAYFAVKPQDIGAYADAIRYLQGLSEALPGRANFAVVDDGSDQVGEVMNLLARRNLLFASVPKPVPGYDLTIQVGKPPFTGKVADDPYLTAVEARSRLGDARRLVRLYGSETTIARLAGDSRRARLHLLHYGTYDVEGLRLRVLGRYKSVKLSAPGAMPGKAEDVVRESGAIEFSIPVIRNYLVVDLE